MNIFRKKSMEVLSQEASNTSLRRTLGAFDVIMLGVGIIIGTGIFVLTGVAAAQYAGPALMLSFVIASVTCAFVSLAYAELASMVPVSGSAYTYTYASMGEFLAWLVGWNLILEYSVGASAVAGGWSAYFVGLIKSAGIDIPLAITAVPADGGIVNLPAIIITLLMTYLLVLGIRESTTANKILVAVKFGAIFLFLFLAGPRVDVTNWQPFMPFGFAGVSAGAAVIFFAYLGFDSVATAAEETKNPKRDMPIGIIGSLIICTLLYILVSGVMTGVVHYELLDTAEPVTFVLRQLGYHFGSAIVGTGALAGLTTVLLVMMYAQTRAFYAISRDGLIPEWLCTIHPRFGTPHIITILVGLGVALISGFTPIHLVAEMCSSGTLFAFIIASIGVVVMRKKYPDAERPFKCPAVYVIAACAVISCAYVMLNLAFMTWVRFIAWSILGTIIYFVYGYSHSGLNHK
ncbi:amino acid permease [Anaerosinus gibii]|uniref:Amino acid permease n=1 Tax=Selenobaculum gibii TaxID=3054208 RepID=A0A9Y2EUX4_9FIRM|nr:amino acid permease [Selenobaculum gbiensis]WIW69949.1 amino acid permease [Selenobaculum gbiensis]